MNRRGFIRNGTRAIIAGGLISMGGFLVFRSQNHHETCNFDFVCKNCKQLKSCNLPEAVQLKNNNKKQNP